MALLMRTQLLTVVMVSMLAMTGCSKTLLSKEKAPSKLIEVAVPKASLSPIFYQELGSQSRFSRANQKNSDGKFQIALDDNLMIVANGGFVYGYQSGQRLWTVATSEPIVSAVGYDGASHVAIVTTRSGNVVAIAGETGDVLWQRPLGATVLTPALIAGNRVLLSANDGVVYGLNLQTGATIWQFNTQNPTVSVRGAAKPLRLDGDSVLIGAPDGRIYALSIDEGAPLWSRRVGVAIGGNDVGRMSDVDATPLVVGNFLYVNSFSGHLMGFDMSTGQTLFSVRDFVSTKPLVFQNGTLYGVDNEGKLIGFNAQTGERLWQNNALTHRKPSNPVIIGNFVAVGDYEGVVHLFDINGDLVGRSQLKNKSPILSLSGIGNRLYAQSTHGVAIWQLD